MRTEPQPDKPDARNKSRAKPKNGAAVGSSDLLGHWVVSVVMVNTDNGIINTQNKLYGIRATSREEAHGKALPLAQSDFPKHHLHTICSFKFESMKWPNV